MQMLDKEFPKVHDRQVLQRLSDTIDDMRLDFEKSITALDVNPVDQSALSTAANITEDFRNLAKSEEIAGIYELSSKMEEILGCLLNNQYAFIHLLSDVLLLSYDHLFDLVNYFIQPSSNFNEDQTAKIISTLDEIISANNDTVYSLAESALQVLTSQFIVMDEAENVAFLVAENQPVVESNAPSQQSIDHTLKIEQDLMFFRKLMEEASYRFPNIKSRCERIIPLAEKMNVLADQRVTPVQLEAAICLHDVGMSFIPDQVLTKNENYSADDREMLKRHPVMIAEMLKRMEVWNEAADIVAQHHEKLDGTGYPSQIVDEQISDGAKILAILDAFDAMTHTRSDRDFKKTILRAVREIVTNSNQFDPAWADVFVQVIKKQYSR